jgi:anthranilate synthase component 2
MKILFIDNKDSFVWNLVDYVSVFEPDTIVVPNTISVDEVRQIKPDAIVISPGPGTPHKSTDVGACLDIIREFGVEIPVMGICFGHQAINAAFGGTVGHAKSGPVHGKTSDISHKGSQLFEGLPENFKVGRYHSLAINELAEGLIVTATTSDGIIMAVEHKEYPVYGVQFHPESILTEKGMRIIGNFLRIAGMGKD